MQVGDDSFLVDFVLGIAVAPTHADDAGSLFRRADLALKNARDRTLPFDIYTPDATRQQATIWKMESDLKQAIANRNLEVYYQPSFDLWKRQVNGAEALVRWRTKGGRLLSPDDFIPLAEASGMIESLTWLVFDKVLEAVRSWQRFGKPFSLAINTAPQTANHPEFCDHLKALKDELAKANVRSRSSLRKTACYRATLRRCRTYAEYARWTWTSPSTTLARAIHR